MELFFAITSLRPQTFQVASGSIFPVLHLILKVRLSQYLSYILGCICKTYEERSFKIVFLLHEDDILLLIYVYI